MRRRSFFLAVSAPPSLMASISGSAAKCSWMIWRSPSSNGPSKTSSPQRRTLLAASAALLSRMDFAVEGDAGGFGVVPEEDAVDEELELAERLAVFANEATGFGGVDAEPRDAAGGVSGDFRFDAEAGEDLLKHVLRVAGRG